MQIFDEQKSKSTLFCPFDTSNVSFIFDFNHLCCRIVFHSYLSHLTFGNRRKVCSISEGERCGRDSNRDNCGVSNTFF